MIRTHIQFSCLTKILSYYKMVHELEMYEHYALYITIVLSVYCALKCHFNDTFAIVIGILYAFCVNGTTKPPNCDCSANAINDMKCS